MAGIFVWNTDIQTAVLIRDIATLQGAMFRFLDSPEDIEPPTVDLAPALPAPIDDVENNRVIARLVIGEEPETWANGELIRIFGSQMYFFRTHASQPLKDAYDAWVDKSIPKHFMPCAGLMMLIEELGRSITTQTLELMATCGYGTYDNKVHRSDMFFVARRLSDGVPTFTVARELRERTETKAAEREQRTLEREA